MTVQSETVDIAVRQDDSEIYDISFDENGDFTLDRSYETSIRMSLWVDSRADGSEIKQQELRRGWWGNNSLFGVLHEIGSRLWLLQQARNTIKTKNRAKDYVTRCLEWLVDNEHAKDVNVVASSEGIYDLILTITITYSADLLETFRFNLWQNTIEF